jgi:hypothetical protein
MGVDEVGRRYLSALRARDDDPDAWIVDAVWFGHDLDESGSAELSLTLRWDLVMAVLDACPDDDDRSLVVGRWTVRSAGRRGGNDRALLSRAGHASEARRLFEAMRRELPSEGVTDGWWFN